jgi:hypothetical protein
LGRDCACLHSWPSPKCPSIAKPQTFRTSNVGIISGFQHVQWVRRRLKVSFLSFLPFLVDWSIAFMRARVLSNLSASLTLLLLFSPGTYSNNLLDHLSRANDPIVNEKTTPPLYLSVHIASCQGQVAVYVPFGWADDRPVSATNLGVALAGEQVQTVWGLYERPMDQDGGPGKFLYLDPSNRSFKADFFNFNYKPRYSKQHRTEPTWSTLRLYPPPLLR